MVGGEHTNREHILFVFYVPIYLYMEIIFYALCPRIF